MRKTNPCLACGACCAFYRASFYFGETDDLTPGGVPASLTEPLTRFMVCMQGTRCKPARCVALMGTVGQAVRCSIYDVRSSICREFPRSWSDGHHNPRCDAARAAHGLPALEPDDLNQRPPRVPPRAA